MNATLQSLLAGLPSAAREQILRALADAHIRDDDPLIAILATIRAADAALTTAAETSANAAAAVQTDVASLHKAAKELAEHASALRNANLRNVAFLLVLAVIVGIALGVVVGKFWL